MCQGNTKLPKDIAPFVEGTLKRMPNESVFIFVARHRFWDKSCNCDGKLGNKPLVGNEGFVINSAPQIWSEARNLATARFSIF
jgi:hypothetical protein